MLELGWQMYDNSAAGEVIVYWESAGSVALRCHYQCYTVDFAR